MPEIAVVFCVIERDFFVKEFGVELNVVGDTTGAHLLNLKVNVCGTLQDHVLGPGSQHVVSRVLQPKGLLGGAP